MVKTSQKKGADEKSSRHKIKFGEIYFLLAFVFVLTVIVAAISNVTDLGINGFGKEPITGKAFTYTNCEKLPCEISKAALDHKYAFSYDDVLYTFRIKEMDGVNKKIKYEIAKLEVDDNKVSTSDLYIDDVEVTKVAGSTLYMDVTVMNQGDDDIYDNFKVRVMTFDEDDSQWDIAEKKVEGLDHDDTVSLEFEVKFDKNYYDSDNKIPYEIKVDTYDVVEESDETNNEEDDHYSS